MKRILIISFLAFWQIAVVFSQTNADDIVGYYMAIDPKSGEKNQIEIYKTADGTYEGKVLWVENKDNINDVGTVQIRCLVYDEKSKQWKNGKVIYDDSEYNLTVSISEPGKLKLRGFVGVSLFGRTVYWIKENELRK